MNKSRLMNQLKYDEGVVYELYRDHLGYLTGGIGHLIRETEPEFDMKVGTEISSFRVYEWFQADVENAIEDCYLLFGDRIFDSFPGEVKEILVNMMFNLGRTRMTSFRRMIRALVNHDWKEAAKEGRDSRWYKQVTNRAERLMKRLERI
jgi:lysozyme